MKRYSSAVDRYVELPYHITLVQDGDDGGGKWIAAAEELPDCTSRGDTAEQAIGGLKDAMAAWISAALKEGRDIPEPRTEASHSGRLLLRMPRTLHAALTKAAERENVSLNQFITDALAGALGWRTTGRKAQVTRPVRGLHGDDEVEPQAAAAEGGRSGSLLFTVNVVLVALAAIVAIVALVFFMLTR